MPKHDVPVAFSGGYQTQHALVMRPYHPFQSSVDDLSVGSKPTVESLRAEKVNTDSSCVLESADSNNKQSVVVMEDTAILGLELEQDSVC